MDRQSPSRRHRRVADLPMGLPGARGRSPGVDARAVAEGGGPVKRLALLSVLAAGSLHAAETPRFEAEVETVYVDAFVSDGGHPVSGLTASDFEVRDGDARRTVRLVASTQVPLDTVLVFDVSESV